MFHTFLPDLSKHVKSTNLNCSLIYTVAFTFLSGHWRHHCQEDDPSLDHWYLWWANDSRAMQHDSGEARRLPDRAGFLSLSYVILVIWHLSLHLIWFSNLWACSSTWRIALYCMQWIISLGLFVGNNVGKESELGFMFGLASYQTQLLFHWVMYISLVMLLVDSDALWRCVHFSWICCWWNVLVEQW